MARLDEIKRPYICGPLTELPVELQEPIKFIYSRLADLCAAVLGGCAVLYHMNILTRFFTRILPRPRSIWPSAGRLASFVHV